MSTRLSILNSLETQLKALASKPNATRNLLTPEMAMKNCPYVGIIVGLDEKLLDRPDGVRYGFRVDLRLFTKKSKCEDLIDQVKTLINSPVNLGTNCLSCLHVGTEPVYTTEDNNYETTKIGLAITYMEPKAGAGNSFSTGVAGSAQYQVLAWIASGSLASNMYDSAFKAGLKTTAISVDVVSVNPITGDYGTRDGGRAVNYSVQLSVKVHTAYDNQGMNTPQNISIMDSVIDRLNSRKRLNDSYLIVDVSGQQYQVTFDSSATTGAEVQVSVHTPRYYTQI